MTIPTLFMVVTQLCYDQLRYCSENDKSDRNKQVEINSVYVIKPKNSKSFHLISVFLLFP